MFELQDFFWPLVGLGLFILAFAWSLSKKNSKGRKSKRIYVRKNDPLFWVMAIPIAGIILTVIVSVISLYF